MSKATEVKQRNYLEALLTSSNKTEACNKAHISRTTANRYENDPDFKKAYTELQRQAMEYTGNKLRSLTSHAVDTLAGVLDDPDASPSDKTRAAKIILDAGFHVQETQDILQRLDNLESEVANE